MKQFRTVLRFEFLNYVGKKAYIVITAVLVLLIAGVLTYPRVSGLFKDGAGEPGGELPVLALADGAYGGDGAFFEKMAAAFPGYRLVAPRESEDAIQDKVKDGQYAGAILIRSPLEFNYVAVSVSLYENPVGVISAVLREAYQASALEEWGIGAEQAQSFVSPAISGIVTETGKSQGETILYTYILIYALYMAILLYGQFVATGVAAEKGTRTMELLITSAKPLPLLFGKVIGSGLAGLLQFGVIFGSAFLFYNLNAGLWAENFIIQRIFNIPLDMLLYALLFFVLGFFLYSFIYGALGSLASRTEDVNGAIMPVTFLFIIALIIVVIGMNTGKLDSPLMIAASYIPFTSPMAMFTRIAMSRVAPWEIAVSVAIAAGSTVAVGYVSAAIYRIGVLMYGKPPQIGQLIKTLRARPRA